MRESFSKTRRIFLHPVVWKGSGDISVPRLRSSLLGGVYEGREFIFLMVVGRKGGGLRRRRESGGGIELGWGEWGRDEKLLEKGC